MKLFFGWEYYKMNFFICKIDMSFYVGNNINNSYRYSVNTTNHKLRYFVFNTFSWLLYLPRVAISAQLIQLDNVTIYANCSKYK